MKRILITGATGNIGAEVTQYLKKFNKDSEIVAAVRDIDKAKLRFDGFSDLIFRRFDFDDAETFSEVFKDIEVLFLLRQPHISEVEKYFRPLLVSAKECGINKIVFLSVQGAEKSKVIPHNKIERLIKELEFNYIFVRPGYFMQNLTTNLLKEIVDQRSITLPSGNAKFNWIDVKNIGEVSAHFLLNFDEFKNNAYDITGTENKSFSDVCQIMTKVLEEKVSFKRMNPIHFYFKKKKEGLTGGFAMVMTILHFLPRFQSEPLISDNYSKFTSNRPTLLKDFIEREKYKFIGT